MSSGSEHLPDRIAALDGSLQAGRSANIESVGPAVAKLSVDVFLKHVLPPLHKSFTPARIDKILAGLKVKHRGSHSASYSSKYQRWTAFDDIEKGTEHATYQALVTISNQITAEVETILKRKTPKRLFDFVNEGNPVPVSAGRLSASKPDAYFVLRDEFRQAKGKSKGKGKEKGKEKAHWMDIGPTGEYKLDNTEKAVRDDLEKILWNVTHTMREDARRRFAFAFTIEGTSMRFWYASRADILMSDSFDFMERPETLLRFFLAFLYATEAEAGWDPTMGCVWEGTTPQYIVDVCDENGDVHQYKTIELLSDIGAGSLRGRGTRVWKVAPYGKSLKGKTSKAETTELVLKDCWVDQGADKEGDIVAAILADAKEKVQNWEKIVAEHGGDSDKLAQLPDEVKFTKDDIQELEKSLLLPSIHGEVRSAGGDRDKTLDRANLWHGDDIPYYFLWRSPSQGDAKSEAQKTTLQNQLKGEHRSVYLCVEGRQKPVMYNAKVHYRLILKEVCQAIRDEKFIHRAYMYLARACIALRLVHKVGWVHRDISAGNIFISKQDVVKLGDFEYAKRMSSDGDKCQDICTGTLDFMAVEVEQTKYLFRSTSTEKPSIPDPDESLTQQDLHLLDDTMGDESPSEMEFASGLAPQPGVRWFYNPIHDMESILWLAKYFTLHKDITFVDKKDHTVSVLAANVRFKGKLVPPETAQERDTRITSQLAYSRTLFYSTEGRQNALMMNDNEWATYLHPALVEAGIVGTLNATRHRVVTRYEEVEKDLTDSAATQILAGRGLYTAMTANLRDACYQIQHLSARVVMRDLAYQASLLHPAPPTADVQVAQALQNLNLQDSAPPAKTPPDVDSNARPALAGPSTSKEFGADNVPQITPPPSRPGSASSGHEAPRQETATKLVADVGPLDPSAGSWKTVKSTKTVRPQAPPPTAPKRVQPKRTPARDSPKATQADADIPPQELSASSGDSGGTTGTNNAGSKRRRRRGGRRG